MGKNTNKKEELENVNDENMLEEVNELTNMEEVSSGDILSDAKNELSDGDILSDAKNELRDEEILSDNEKIRAGFPDEMKNLSDTMSGISDTLNELKEEKKSEETKASNIKNGASNNANNHKKMNLILLGIITLLVLIAVIIVVIMNVTLSEDTNPKELMENEEESVLTGFEKLSADIQNLNEIISGTELNVLLDDLMSNNITEENKVGIAIVVGEGQYARLSGEKAIDRGLISEAQDYETFKITYNVDENTGIISEIVIEELE